MVYHTSALKPENGDGLPPVDGGQNLLEIFVPTVAALLQPDFIISSLLLLQSHLCM